MWINYQGRARKQAFPDFAQSASLLALWVGLCVGIKAMYDPELLETCHCAVLAKVFESKLVQVSKSLPIASIIAVESFKLLRVGGKEDMKEVLKHQHALSPGDISECWPKLLSRLAFYLAQSKGIFRKLLTPSSYDAWRLLECKGDMKIRS